MLGRKADRPFARSEWRVSAKADAHINDAECFELVVSCRPIRAARRAAAIGSFQESAGLYSAKLSHALAYGNA